MEDALVHALEDSASNMTSTVLILVLMEDALVQFLGGVSDAVLVS